MLSRSKSRRQALQILYQREVTGEPVRRILALESYAPYIGLVPEADTEENEQLEPASPDEFTITLIEGTEKNCTEIDEWIEQTSENWVVSRMPLVDLSILRLATFEMLYLPEVPHGASINEAIELAKMYGTDESPKFVNGVLGKISRRAVEEGRVTGGSDATEGSAADEREVPDAGSAPKEDPAE